MNINQAIFLDNQSTTKLDDEVFKKMMPYFTESYGNPHSINHSFGRNAQFATEAARKEIAEYLSANHQDVYFTSGATESNNIFIKGLANFSKVRNKRIITSKADHKCVLQSCKRLEEQGFNVEYLDIDKSGLIDLQNLENALKTPTLLTSIMFVNNETGVIEGLLDDNYDLGMPGSGILIWHIDETFSSNNDRDNKMVHLEEADGIVNIGLSEPFFGSGWIIDGWQYDYWFDGNEFYEQQNSDNNSVLINEISSPNSNLNSNTPSYFEIEISSIISDEMTVNISSLNDVFTIAEIDTDIYRILGNDGYCMFYIDDNASSVNDIKTYGTGEYCNLEYLSELDFDLSCSKNFNLFNISEFNDPSFIPGCTFLSGTLRTTISKIY